MAAALPSSQDCCATCPPGECGTPINVTAIIAGLVQQYTCLGLDNWTMLRAVTGYTPNMKVILFGGKVIGDGLGGPYYFNAADVRSDDGINVIIPNDMAPGSPGRWNQA